MATRRAMVAASLMLTAAARIQAQSAGESQLLGLWAYEGNFDPALQGELRVTRSGAAWRAVLGQVNGRASVNGRDIRFDFGVGGVFRGHLAPEGRFIDGFWVQPAGKTRIYAFATPTRLRATRDGEWRGEVKPLSERFTLYLSIFRDEKNRLVAAFRNPERNAIGGASRFLVTRLGDSLRFALKYEGGEIVHDATFLRSPERIRVTWEDVEGPIELTRRDPARASGFFPRVPGSSTYVYARPPETGDGWRTAAARELGINEAALEGAVRNIIASDPTEQPATLIHSLLVAYRGRLVLEEYFFGYDRDQPHDLRSAGKTFASVMLGAVMRNGVALSPESRITRVLGGLAPFGNPDPRKDRITLAHLMTHSAGLACNDNDDNSPGNESTMDSQKQQPNWWKYTLDLPMAYEPGVRYAYCSANINLVGGALTVGTRTWLPELFERTVARPLQFGPWHWNLMPNGEGYLGGGAFLRPRDLLKLGQAYLNGGVWNGGRIVDSSWVASSTRSRMPITPETTGYSAGDFGNYYGGGSDALAWHQSNFTIAGRTVLGYAASGNGGQVLVVVPEYQLTAVFTGGNYRQGGVWGRWAKEIIGDKIIPAIGSR